MGFGLRGFRSLGEIVSGSRYGAIHLSTTFRGYAGRLGGRFVGFLVLADNPG